MPISSDTRAAILEDLKEDRLTYGEIAAKRLGNSKRKGDISKIATSAGISRKDRQGKSRKSFKAKVSPKKPPSRKLIKIETFEADIRLSLIDEALSYLKSCLPEIYSPKGFSEWTSSVERLLNQRRIEAPAAPIDPEDDGFMMALEAKTPKVWQDAPNIPVQMDSPQHPPMENLNLVGDGLTDKES